MEIQREIRVRESSELITSHTVAVSHTKWLVRPNRPPWPSGLAFRRVAGLVRAGSEVSQELNADEKFGARSPVHERHRRRRTGQTTTGLLLLLLGSIDAEKKLAGRPARGGAARSTCLRLRCETSWRWRLHALMVFLSSRLRLSKRRCLLVSDGQNTQIFRGRSGEFVQVHAMDRTDLRSRRITVVASPSSMLANTTTSITELTACRGDPFSFSRNRRVIKLLKL